MNAEEKNHLNHLLKKVATEEGGWIPEECRVSFYKLAVTPFIELAVMRQTEKGNEYFLAYREDQDFTGWHIPGGMIKPNYPEDLAGICKTLVDRELPGGRIIGDIYIVKTLKWSKHPWANPFAILCLFKMENIQETEKMKFFSAHKLPVPMISQHHVDYIEDCEKFLKLQSYSLAP